MTTQTPCPFYNWLPGPPWSKTAGFANKNIKDRTFSSLNKTRNIFPGSNSKVTNIIGMFLDPLRLHWFEKKKTIHSSRSYLGSELEFLLSFVCQQFPGDGDWLQPVPVVSRTLSLCLWYILKKDVCYHNWGVCLCEMTQEVTATIRDSRSDLGSRETLDT